MSFSLNRVCLGGYISTDITFKETETQKSVASFSLATNETIGNKKQVDFHRIVAWGALAQACKNYLVKGQLIALEGRLKQSIYTKDSQKRSSTQVVADRITFGPRPDGREPAEPWKI